MSLVLTLVVERPVVERPVVERPYPQSSLEESHAQYFFRGLGGQRSLLLEGHGRSWCKICQGLGPKRHKSSIGDWGYSRTSEEGVGTSSLAQLVSGSSRHARATGNLPYWAVTFIPMPMPRRVSRTSSDNKWLHAPASVLAFECESPLTNLFHGPRGLQACQSEPKTMALIPFRAGAWARISRPAY